MGVCCECECRCDVLGCVGCGVCVCMYVARYRCVYIGVDERLGHCHFCKMLKCLSRMKLLQVTEMQYLRENGRSDKAR